MRMNKEQEALDTITQRKLLLLAWLAEHTLTAYNNDTPDTIFHN